MFEDFAFLCPLIAQGTLHFRTVQVHEELLAALLVRAHLCGKGVYPTKRDIYRDQLAVRQRA